MLVCSLVKRLAERRRRRLRFGIASSPTPSVLSGALLAVERGLISRIPRPHTFTGGRLSGSGNRGTLATGIVGTSWNLLDITGPLTIEATSGNPFTIAITSLNAGNEAGDEPNWTPDANHSTSIAATTTGVLNFSTDRFTLDTSAFSNATNGTWSLGVNGNSLDLIYPASAVPEPDTFALLAGFLALGFAATRRRNR